MRYRTPSFKLTLSQFFLRVGLFPTCFWCCRRRGDTTGVGSTWKPSIAWTWVHAIIHQRTCAISGLSEFLDGRHVAAWEHQIFIGCTMLIGRLRSIANSEITGHRVDASGASDLHRMGDANEVRGGVGSVGFSSRFRSRSHRNRDPNRKAHLRTRGPLWGVRSLDLHRTAEKTRGRNPRSWRDRTAIAGWSSHDCGSFIAESPPRSLNDVHWRIEITINSRSWPDRGAIVVRSWLFWSKIVAHSMPIRKPHYRQGESLPRPIQSAPTTASIGHDLRANFLFKKRCILPLKINFWSIREVN